MELPQPYVGAGPRVGPRGPWARMPGRCRSFSFQSGAERGEGVRAGVGVGPSLEPARHLVLREDGAATEGGARLGSEASQSLGFGPLHPWLLKALGGF